MSSLSYDANGNLAGDFAKGAADPSTYTYDAENRLIGADNNDTNQHLSFTYDTLNRQILRFVNGTTIRSVWDGWNLIEERSFPDTLLHSYVHGAGSDEMVERSGSGPAVWYSQDGRGNTSHLSDAAGNLVEKYRYDVYGAPHFYNAAGTPLSASAYDNSFLFAGRHYLQETGLYDCRNRFYHPSLGRFLQPDPISFKGDSANLYRYCGNNSVNSGDPMGLRVEIGFHPVIEFGMDMGGDHSFIVLIPDDPSAFDGDPLFTNINGLPTATISGQPVNGNLNSTFNSDLGYVNNTTTLTVTPPDGISDTQFILNLISTATAYPNDTIPYNFAGLAGYNSNGLVNYIFTKNGKNGRKLLKKLPANFVGGGRRPPVGKYTREPFDDVHLDLHQFPPNPGTDPLYGPGGFGPGSVFGPVDPGLVIVGVPQASQN